MRALKVVILLALISAAATIFLVYFLSLEPDLIERAYALPLALHRRFAGWFTIFLLSVLGAGTAGLFTLRKGKAYPGLATGTLIVVLLAGLVLIGDRADRYASNTTNAKSITPSR